MKDVAHLKDLNTLAMQVTSILTIAQVKDF